MSPLRLALRTILLGRARSVLAMLLIGASLCALELYAGHVAGGKARLEQQAVIGERLGHLTVGRAGMLESGEAVRVRYAIEGLAGVALVVPQMSVSGIISSGERSALFHGEGLSNGAGLPGQPGTLNPSVGHGIALSGALALALGVRKGAKLTLHGATADAPSVAVQAEVVDVFKGSAAADAPGALLMPLEMARRLRATTRTERLLVYLNEPALLQVQRDSMAEALRAAGHKVDISTWQERSASYLQERRNAALAADSIAVAVFAVIAAVIAATLSMNALERRREVGTLRALGMRGGAVVLMFVAEAVWMALIGILLSLMASGLIAWLANRAVMRAPMQVELDFTRMLMAVLAVLIVTVLAALAPAVKAARGAIPDALGG
jgi:putative ABC transport system permease protein